MPGASERDTLLESKNLGQKCLKNCLAGGTEAQILSKVGLCWNRSLGNLQCQYKFDYTRDVKREHVPSHVKRS
jgi:hypothetical protein